MKKLLTLTVMLAGVALFAGCLNKPTSEEVIVPEAEVVEVTPEVVMPVEEVAPTVEVIEATDATMPTAE